MENSWVLLLFSKLWPRTLTLLLFVHSCTCLMRLVHHPMLFYVGVNSIKLYTFWDYSRHSDFEYPVFESPLYWNQNLLTASSLTTKDFKISTSPTFVCLSQLEFWTLFFFTFLVLEVTAASILSTTFEAVASSLTPTDESLYDIPLAESFKSVSNKIKGSEGIYKCYPFDL